MEKLEASPAIQDFEKVIGGADILQPKNDIELEKVDGDVPPDEPSSIQDDHEYISGIQLGLVVGAVSLCSFLMLLDTAIIVTVCYTHLAYLSVLTIWIGYSENY